MPKYRNKIRVKKYLSKDQEITPLIEFLILEDHPDDIIEIVKNDGIDIFISDWEESAKHIATHSDYDEYDFDISCRTDLSVILQHTPPDQLLKFDKRIKTADDLFKRATKRIKSEKKQNTIQPWWLQRTLK